MGFAELDPIKPDPIASFTCEGGLASEKRRREDLGAISAVGCSQRGATMLAVTEMAISPRVLARPPFQPSTK
jgi:hypothetical protein